MRGAGSWARCRCGRRVPAARSGGRRGREGCWHRQGGKEGQGSAQPLPAAGGTAGGRGAAPSRRASSCSLLPPSQGASAVTGRHSDAQRRSGHRHRPVKGQRSLPAGEWSFHMCVLLPVWLHMCLQKVGTCEGNRKKVSPGQQGLKHCLP